MNFSRVKQHKIAVLFVLGLLVSIALALCTNLFSEPSTPLYKTNGTDLCNSNKYKWKIDISDIYESESIFNRSNEHMLKFVNAKENGKEASEITRITKLLLERDQNFKNFKYNHESNDVIFRYEPIDVGPFLFCSFRSGKLYNELYISFTKEPQE